MEIVASETLFKVSFNGRTKAMKQPVSPLRSDVLDALKLFLAKEVFETGILGNVEVVSDTSESISASFIKVCYHS
jgi:hypothetical protein